MSHASLLVALDPTEDIKAAIAVQMEPFDESVNHPCSPGSRWDWWQIGGRFTGTLDSYDPRSDPKNIETCPFCGGTGKRPDMEVANGCNGCQGKGARVKWSYESHPGDIMPRSEVHVETMRLARIPLLTQQWEKAQQEPAESRELWTGVKPEETLEQYLERHDGFPAHYAFLRNRNWHEHERLGWFGGTAATECERNGKETHICTHEKDGARIISWGGSASWDKMFYPRFVEPLAPETLLVTVDYHV